MMDKKTLIENGILEQYLLGELSPNEQKEVEALIHSDKELQSYFDSLEADFETIGMENAIAPPGNVKKQLMTNIAKGNDTHIVDLKSPTPFKPYFKIAASIAAFFLLGTLWMYSELNDIKKQLKVVETENNQLNSNIENLNTYLEETNKWYVAINDPDVQKYVLTGNALLPEAKVISYVNHQNRSVVINTKRLPKLNDDKDYQMWADVQGKMINMGIISKNKDMLAMKYIDEAESLNITIEPAGGNDHPTVSQLITNVYLQ